MEELSYTSKFDGETTDDILGYANEGKTEKVNEYVKSMNVQDSEGNPIPCRFMIRMACRIRCRKLSC